MSNYRLSIWVHVFERSGVVALFHSLTMDVVYFERSIWEEMFSESINQEYFQYLLNSGFIVQQNYNDKTELYRLRERLKKEVGINILYLILTDACNLKCKYCFEDSSDVKNFKPQAMNEEVLTKAIELFFEITQKYGNNNKKRIINLYGGEPLLNKNMIFSAIELIDKINLTLRLNLQIGIVTNGVFLDEALCKFFKQHNVTVGLSIDGPRGITNKNRLSFTELDVFDRAVEAYKMLKKYDVKTGLSVTIVPELLEDEDHILDFFINDLGIKDGISFNILHHNKGVPTDSDYFKRASKFLIKAFGIFRKINVYEERMMRKAKSFVYKTPVFADCGIVGSQMVVAPDGSIGVCPDFIKPRKYFIGTVFDQNFDPIKNGLYKDWEYRSPLYMDKCELCPAISSCGGGCPAGLDVTTGNIWDIDQRICSHSKDSLMWFIWDSYDKMNV